MPRRSPPGPRRGVALRNHRIRHYRRNSLGRALASKRTRIIALLYPALQRRLSETA
ncbi:hypothetical protein ACFVTE_20650 [Arthrobacter sp. NPDC058097]|uniref:hypothetical protein n=1 Tax=Arthrobacter sp. NPDC058097 TaxID=3346340 RepID=UPI0036D7F57B